jgi:hypothetical protein
MKNLTEKLFKFEILIVPLFVIFVLITAYLINLFFGSLIPNPEKNNKDTFITATPIPSITENNNQFRIEVEKGYFAVYKNGKEVTRVMYRDPAVSDGIMIVYDPDIILFEPETLIFATNVFPMGCESGEDTECLTFAGEVINEHEKYGGIWRLNLKTKELMLIKNKPALNSDEFVSYEFSINDHLVNVKEVINNNEGEISTEIYIIDAVKGKVLN